MVGSAKKFTLVRDDGGTAHAGVAPFEYVATMAGSSALEEHTW